MKLRPARPASVAAASNPSPRNRRAAIRAGGSPARRDTGCIWASAGPGTTQFSRAVELDFPAAYRFRPDGAHLGADPRPTRATATRLAKTAQRRSTSVLAVCRPDNSTSTFHRGPNIPWAWHRTSTPSPFIAIKPSLSLLPCPSTLVSTPAHIAPVDPGQRAAYTWVPSWGS